MTSEILIMNSDVIVMAADSALTVNDKKTYDGANKLFKLSNNPPMAMMIFGTANFGPNSLESLIKDFVNQTNFEELGDILKVKESFLDYLNNVPYENHDFENKLEDIKHELLDLSENISEDDFINYMDNFKTMSILSFLEDESLTHRFESIKDEFDDIDVDVIKKYFSKIFLDLSSGIVISGFNRNELLPSCISFDLITKYGNEIIIQDVDSYIDYGENLILAFAQYDVIETFMLGMHEDFELLIDNAIENFLDLYDGNLMGGINEDKDFDNNGSSESIRAIFDKTDLLIRTEFNKILMGIVKLKELMLKQIIDTIGFLPVNDLVKMAQSMIYITSLRRKFDSDLETVGGNIDVAILSKGDGFLWKEELLST